MRKTSITFIAFLLATMMGINGVLPVLAAGNTDSVLEETTAQQPIENAYSEQEIEVKTSDEQVVTVSGLLPEKADVVVDPVDYTEEDVLCAYDITIYDSVSEDPFQPEEGSPVTVRIACEDVVTAKESGQTLSVWHIHDDGTEEEIKDFTVKDGEVVFEATGFSIYIIKGHEDQTGLDTPRVFYHFFDHPYQEEGGVYYSHPYLFQNKAGEYANTQIIKDGDVLENVPNPPEYSDGGYQYQFYGWYIVQLEQDGYTQGTATNGSDDVYRYQWLDPVRQEFNSPISVTGTTDTDVYLAPLYMNQRFVTFYEDSIWKLLDVATDTYGPGPNSNKILTRKLAALNSDNEAQVLISDVYVPQPDATHEFYYCWQSVERFTDDEHKTGEPLDYTLYIPTNTGYEVRTYINKVLTDTEVFTRNDTNMYAKVTANSGSFNLYPVFRSARWLYFLAGPAGSGAKYINSKLVWDDETISYLEPSERYNYRFDGWYAYNLNGADPQYDADGNITNGGNGIQLTDGNGNVLQNVSGLTDAVVRNGQLQLYEDFTVYGHWTPLSSSTYTVVVWKQKVSDSKNAVEADKTYDYETSTRITATTGSNINVSSYQNLSFEGFHYARTEQNSTTVRADGTTTVNVYYDRDFKIINFYYYNNVAYPANATTAYTYTATTGNTGTQYGIVGDQWLQLTRSGSGASSTYTCDNYYEDYYADNDGAYGLVDGEYVLLSPVINTEYSYQTETTYNQSTATSGELYYLENGEYQLLDTAIYHVYTWQYYRGGRNRNYTGTLYVLENGTYVSSGKTTSSTFREDDDTTYYALYNGTYYVANTNQTSSTTTVIEKDGEPYTGTRYAKAAGSDYTGTRYTRNGVQAPFVYTATDEHEGAQYGVDARGGHIPLSRTATSSVVGYTYMDDNGEIHEYTGQHYTYGLVRGTGTMPYTGTRYTRSTLNNFRMITWTGLYGQTFVQNGYSWDDVSGFYWREGTTGNSGTGQTFLSAFIQDAVPYNLATRAARGNNVIYQTRQGLDGTYSMDNATTTYSSSTGAFNFTNKFTGFTVHGYSTGTFSSTGGNALPASMSLSSPSYPLYVYHQRNNYSLTFDGNIPIAEQDDNGTQTTVFDTVPYESKLSTYAAQVADPTRLHYTFTGWYANPECTTYVFFKEPTAADFWNQDGTHKLWAKDGNGDYVYEEDGTTHVMLDYIVLGDKSSTTGDSEHYMPANNLIVYAGWEPIWYKVTLEANGGEILRSQGRASYFWKQWGSVFDEYALTRPYIADLEGTYIYAYSEANREYRYIPVSEFGEVAEGEYSTASEWNTYMRLDDEMYAVDPTNSYSLLGWYKVLYPGTAYERLATTPYSFSDIVEEDITLRAIWRISGTYIIAYNGTYQEPGTNEVLIPGTAPQAFDPLNGSVADEIGYTDQSSAIILPQPPDYNHEFYAFEGWRIVDENSNPLEINKITGEPELYQPGDTFRIDSKYADRYHIIRLQAYYTTLDQSSRRPSVVGLMLDANGGHVNSNNLVLSDELGLYNAAYEDDLPSAATEGIWFEKRQNNFSVDLSTYGIVNRNFTHSSGYMLIGWNRSPEADDYIPDIYADAVIGVDKEDEENNILYALWEQMVYLTFRNETEESITFRVRIQDNNGTNLTDALTTNEVVSLYERQTYDLTQPITLAAGETLKLVVPQGAGYRYMVSGTYVGSDDILYVYNSGGPAAMAYRSGVNTYSTSGTLIVDASGVGREVIFTSEERDIVPSGVNRDNTAYLLMAGVGVLIVFGIVISRRKRKTQ